MFLAMLHILSIVLTYQIDWEGTFKRLHNWAIHRKDCFFLGLSKDIQKEPPEVIYKKAVLKNSTIFTGRHLCWSRFSPVLESLQLYQKGIPMQVFSCEYCGYSKNSLFIEHLRGTASRSWIWKHFPVATKESIICKKNNETVTLTTDVNMF